MKDTKKKKTKKSSKKAPIEEFEWGFFEDFAPEPGEAEQIARELWASR